MKVALWILNRFAVNPSLVGDLTEEWSSGHSSWWLLRQTLVAIASAIWSGLWHHKLRTVGAIIAGFVSVFVFNFAFWNLWMRATSGRGFIRGWPLVLLIVAGWIVGKLQPAQPLGTVFLFFATIASILVSSGTSNGILPPSLPVLVLRGVLQGAPILLAVGFGGLLATRRPGVTQVLG